MRIRELNDRTNKEAMQKIEPHDGTMLAYTSQILVSKTFKDAFFSVIRADRQGRVRGIQQSVKWRLSLAFAIGINPNLVDQGKASKKLTESTSARTDLDFKDMKNLITSFSEWLDGLDPHQTLSDFLISQGIILPVSI